MKTLNDYMEMPYRMEIIEDKGPESGRTIESDCLRLLHELHPVFREPVQSVVYFHCRYLLHLKVSRQFRSDRNVGERDEFPASDVALRDFGRDHCTQYVCAERLYHSACQRHAYRLPKQIYQE